MNKISKTEHLHTYKIFVSLDILDTFVNAQIAADSRRMKDEKEPPCFKRPEFSSKPQEIGRLDSVMRTCSPEPWKQRSWCESLR